ncbi:DUF2892 domain-containing protein [Mucilaginibacter rubeus]|uniref:DUF2892 domain-containing protein n=1 Tax=Mucilaginibacter rubeus TaxID=2027860 RepID=A0AAE6JIE3_9SPHI|nr:MULTISPECIES: DUF2892 domain-containing protein [Mucilaginibacter]QEM05993.1 DUF2892 domain-containing protein [Mucilaginibacter rubeus]QEM18574.1 DUF2892 domain-containing protein [Mucilaginibacter gossypii]QTE44883.1 DUF2892 domain-containing protein [Mucilaginibacter rubeus]QTE51481.1 DUF2892 domain-containing protein [Mucilaginibacter rubeus]QTE56567.1 DUF2892 domain-containing protein [Mucilaginibacter rubeus]
MKKNMGTLDRSLRILAALAIAILYYTGVLSGTLAIILLALAAIFILTGFISFCPLYYPFKISTRKTGA